MPARALVPLARDQTMPARVPIVQVSRFERFPGWHTHVERFSFSHERSSGLAAALDLAWVLAAHPDPQFRGGPEALRLANEYCQQTNFGNPHGLDALAAAYAESGDYVAAVELADRVIAAAQAAGLEELARALHARRREYAAGRPYRTRLHLTP